MKTLETIALNNRLKANSILLLLNSNFGEDEIIEALQDIVNYLSDTAYDLEEFHDDFSALVQKLVELP